MKVIHTHQSSSHRNIQHRKERKLCFHCLFDDILYFADINSLLTIYHSCHFQPLVLLAQKYTQTPRVTINLII